MKFTILYTILFVHLSFWVVAQPNALQVNSNINLPTDTTVSKSLVSSLKNFLIAARSNNKENQFVLDSEKMETYLLLDEINGIEESRKFKNNYFYTPYLTNIVAIENNKYLVQVSYIGIDGASAILRINFELIAHNTGNSFVFSSPLLRNTSTWQEKKVGNHIFHYQTSINQKSIKSYNSFVAFVDKKLEIKDKLSEYYCCKDLAEALRLLGVNYKSDYNGSTEGVFNTSLDNRLLCVLGNNNAKFDNFDPHDLWHDRLSLIVSRREVNKPIDEACAYLYGGSWGMSWNDILAQFMNKVASGKNLDWANFKENPVNFGPSEEKHLMVDYVVNALLVQKIEKEKGFSAVWKFLNCGPYEKGNANYYNTLEKLTGITKENYNEKINELVNSQK